MSTYVDLSSQSDSVLSTASNTKYCDEISPKEQFLLQILRRGMLETYEENTAFGKELMLLLSKLNLEPQTLPNDIKEGLQKIALILKHEKLSDIDDVTLSIISERKKIEEKKRIHEEKHLALLYDDLFRKYSGFSKKLDQLQEAASSLECFIQNSQEEQNDIYYNRATMSARLKEYQQTTEKLERDITNMQIDDLYPKEILNKYHSYLEMSGELAELNQWLSQYGNLPPNLLQAKALVEIKRKEYEALEKDFLKKTNLEQ
ncbi:uncharacterized protein LOC108630266 isoform X2 [Ceratina calcarata]|uniref:Uncharacterized protein LOC108630266 isoform X2 n=1 Tax=Ceratina calcarata TaxID=156304 RepID=A0AAJ7S9E3_9HYME|nr:uncharacterized protein LOC108630266 isoform X2 [Ceratina calcarata]